MGGMLELIGGLLEFFLGNTFAFVLFGVLGGSPFQTSELRVAETTYSALGAFFMSFAVTLTPSFDAFGAYSSDPANPAEGLMAPGFNASFGRYPPHLSQPEPSSPISLDSDPPHILPRE